MVVIGGVRGTLTGSELHRGDQYERALDAVGRYAEYGSTPTASHSSSNRSIGTRRTTSTPSRTRFSSSTTFGRDNLGSPRRHLPHEHRGSEPRPSRCGRPVTVFTTCSSPTATGWRPAAATSTSPSWRPCFASPATTGTSRPRRCRCPTAGPQPNRRSSTSEHSEAGPGHPQPPDSSGPGAAPTAR